MKKILALLLCIAVAASAAACALFNPPESTESESTTGGGAADTDNPYVDTDILKEAQSRLEGYKKLDFGGKKITIVCPAGTVDVYQPTDPASSLASARILRNLNVSGILGIELAVMYTKGDIASELSMASESGDIYADLVSLPQNRIGVLAKRGTLQNLVSLPYASVRGDGYNNTAYSASTAIYGVCGDFNFNPSDLDCVYYNEKLCEGKNIDPQKLYDDGKWTAEEFAKTLRLLDGSLDGKYGYAWMSAELGSENRITDLIYSASGLSYMKSEGDAFADVVSDAAANAVSIIRDLISLRRLSVTDMLYEGDAFKRGDLYFYSDSLSYSLSIPSAVDWNVLPVPSADGKTFATLLPATAEMLCMPSGSPSLEACGAFIGAFCAFSDGYISSMFLRDVLNTSARSSNAISNMKKIISSAVCDFAFITAPAYVYAAAASYGAVRTSVKSGRTIADVTDGIIASARAELAG